MSHPFITHLKKDHEKQHRLGEQLTKATDPQRRKTLLKELYEETRPHMEGEEASIFAFMRASGDEEAKEHALEAVQEHHVNKLLFRELLAMSAAGEVFKAKASVLDELNRHHTDEEETYHFPWLEKHASAKELDDLFKQYEKAEAKAKKS